MVSTDQFICTINAAYDEVVHWKRNIFSVPTGWAGNNFVSELTSLFRAYTDSSALEVVALFASMVLPILLL